MPTELANGLLRQYVMGPALKQFETDLARYCGTKYAVGVNSGTDALWLTFPALGIPVTKLLRQRILSSPQQRRSGYGYNSRLDDLHAAILSVKLKKITQWTDRRREIAARYTRGLQGTSFTLPYEPPGYRHVYHLYVLEHPKRDSLEAFLLKAGIDVKLHYPIAIHQQEVKTPMTVTTIYAKLSPASNFLLDGDVLGVFAIGLSAAL